MRRPPRFVIPGDAYTWRLSEHMDTTFTKLCKLLLILNEVALAYFADSDSRVEDIVLDFAERQYRRLLEWAKINGSLIDNWDSTPHHSSYVQVIFHTGILEIFRPFLGVDTPLKSFQRRHYTPKSIFMASYKQLSYQILIYPLIHPAQNFIWWFTGCVTAAWFRAVSTMLSILDRINQVVNATMTTIEEDPNSMQMFLLCLLTLYDLSICFPVMEDVIRGLLVIATRKGIVSNSAARHLYEQVKRSRWSRLRTNQAGTGLVVDLSQAQRLSDSATVSQLTKDFDDVVINMSD